MLDVNKINLIIKQHPRIFFIVSAVILFGLFLIVFLAPKSSAPVTPNIVSLPPTTPTPIQATLYLPPQTVDFSQSENLVQDERLPSYSINLNHADLTLPPDLLSQFGLPTKSEDINTEFIKLRTWRGSNYYLSFNLLARQISLGLTHDRQLTNRGSFQTPIQLSQKTINLITALRVFDPLIKFSLENTTFFSAVGEWPEPTTEGQSQFVTLILTPTINDYPIYQQEIPFIAASFDRTNSLIKLQITNPISSLSLGEPVSLANFDKIKTRLPETFFRLFVQAQTTEEYFLSAPDIQNIVPKDVSLGYFLKDGSLQPIFLLRTRSYLYATKASLF